MAQSEKKNWFTDLAQELEQIITNSGEASQSVQKLEKSIQKVSTASSKLRRNLASFDQLNRLSEPAGSSAQQVTQLNDAMEELRDTMAQVSAMELKPLNVHSLDNMSGALVGVSEKLHLVGEDLLRGSENANKIAQSLGFASDKTKLFGTDTVLTKTQLMQFAQEVTNADGTLNFHAIMVGAAASAVSNLVNGYSSAADNAGLSASKITGYWQNMGTWFSQNVASPIGQLAGNLFGGMTQNAQSAWNSTKGVFSGASSFFESTFSNAWNRVKAVFSGTGQVAVGIKDGVLSGFKSAVNALIDSINSTVTTPFNGLNAVLEQLRSIRINGRLHFAHLKWNSALPRIPHLAQGAVLPANKPFLAVVGDQRHGTNVEAPLETITQAVRVALEDLQGGNLAGHQATVELLGAILEAVRRIRLTDATIAAAADRFHQKQAVIHGVGV